jgi:hypothetical protein
MADRVTRLIVAAACGTGTPNGSATPVVEGIR